MDAHRCFFRSWSVLAVVFLVAGFLAQSAPAYAQDANPDVLNKVTNLNKKALQAFQKRDYDSARDFLKEALDLCNGSGLEKHPIRARTEVHIGVVLIAGYKQRDAGIKHFKKALEIQPDIQLTKSVSTKALQDAFEEATVAQGGAGGDDSSGGAQASNDDNAGGGDSAGGDDNPAPRRRPPPKKKKKRGDDDDDDSGAAVSKHKGEDDGDGDDDGGGTDNKGKIFIGLTGGSGFGIASGTGEMASTVKHTLASAGFAPAQLMQVAPEVGYFLSSNLLLSLQGRVQFVSGLNPGATTCGSTKCTTASTAIAVFAKATYLLGDGDFHFFFGGSLGGGTIRHVSQFPADTSCVNGTSASHCVDTLAAGPLLFGPNLGIMYEFTKNLGLIVALNTQVGVPKFTFNLDLDAGLGLKF